MSTTAKRIRIKLPSDEVVSVSDLPKNRLKKELVEKKVLGILAENPTVLCVCDRIGKPVFLNNGAFKLFGLPTKHHLLLPDLVVYSHEYQCLFFIDVFHGRECIDRGRFNDLTRWAMEVPGARYEIASVFESRAAYWAHDRIPAPETSVWFLTEPGHSLYISESPSLSQRLLAARMARKEIRLDAGRI